MVAGRLPLRIKGGRAPVLDQADIETSYTAHAVRDGGTDPIDPIDPIDPMPPVGGPPGAPTNVALSNVAYAEENPTTPYTSNGVTVRYANGRDTGFVVVDQPVMSMSWVAPTDNGGSAITSYDVEISIESEPDSYGNTDGEDVFGSISATLLNAFTTPQVQDVGLVTSVEFTAVDFPVRSGSYPALVAFWNTTTGSSRRFYYRYTIRVRANNTHGPGGWSGELTLYQLQWSFGDSTVGPMPTQPPGQVPSVSVSAGDANVDITWGAPTTGGDPTGYLIEYQVRANNLGPWASWQEVSPAHSGTERSYEHAGLVNGNAYRYRVTAMNSAGSGAPSSTSESVIPEAVTPPPMPMPPNTPDAPTGSGGDGVLQVTWNTPSGGTPTDYDLRFRFSTDGGTVFSTEYEVPFTGTLRVAQISRGTSSGGLIHNITNGNIYQVSVRASNAEGTSSWSAWSANLEPVGGTPPAPENVSVTVGESQLTLTWDEPTTTITLDSYDIQWRTVVFDMGGSVPGASTDVFDRPLTPREYVHTGLTNGTYYQYRVRAVSDSDVNGIWSDWTVAATPTAPALEVPGQVPQPGVIPGNQRVNLSWQLPPDGGTPQNYEIRRQHQLTDGRWTIWGTIATVGTTPREYNDTGLTNGRSYRYGIRATNSDGNGLWSSNSGTTIPYGVPPAPTEAPDATITNQSGGFGSILTVIVAMPASDLDNNGREITHYEWDVQYRIGAQGANDVDVVTNRRTTGDLSWSESQRTGTVYYRVRYRALNVAGAGGESPWTTYALPVTPVPSVPAADTFTVGVNIRRGRWPRSAFVTASLSSAPDDNGSEITSYDFNQWFRSQRNNGTWTDWREIGTYEVTAPTMEYTHEWNAAFDSSFTNREARFRVRATNANGDGDYTDYKSVTYNV